MEAPDDLVTLPDIAQAAGISPRYIRKAVNEGLIDPAPVRKAHGTKTFTREDADFIIGVALLAVAAGVAFIVLFRAIAASGGTLDGGAIKIPVPAINLNT